jgi:hypothetical protein
MSRSYVDLAHVEKLPPRGSKLFETKPVRQPSTHNQGKLKDKRGVASQSSETANVRIQYYHYQTYFWTFCQLNGFQIKMKNSQKSAPSRIVTQSNQAKDAIASEQESAQGGSGRRGQIPIRTAAQSDNQGALGEDRELSADSNYLAKSQLNSLKGEICRVRALLGQTVAQREHTKQLVEVYDARINLFQARVDDPDPPLGPPLRAELRNVERRLKLAVPVMPGRKKTLNFEKSLHECKRLHESGKKLLQNLQETERLCEVLLLELTQD